MTAEQLEVFNLVCTIFTPEFAGNISSEKLKYKIKNEFNLLSLSDEDWYSIEESVLNIFQQISRMK